MDNLINPSRRSLLFHMLDLLLSEDQTLIHQVLTSITMLQKSDLKGKMTT